MKIKPFPDLMAAYETLIARPHEVNFRFYNRICERNRYLALTGEYVPRFRMYGANPETNPNRMQTAQDPLRTVDRVATRCAMSEKNIAFLRGQGK